MMYLEMKADNRVHPHPGEKWLQFFSKYYHRKQKTTVSTAL